MPVPQLVRMKKMLLRLASALELPANPLDQARTIIECPAHLLPPLA